MAKAGSASITRFRPRTVYQVPLSRPQMTSSSAQIRGREEQRAVERRRSGAQSLRTREKKRGTLIGGMRNPPRGKSQPNIHSPHWKKLIIRSRWKGTIRKYHHGHGRRFDSRVLKCGGRTHPPRGEFPTPFHKIPRCSLTSRRCLKQCTVGR
ncbi:hypothetical protein B0H14DRAFT_2872286 [Mycena olivaceomarginata]|nr:hypothetical protein B0H14DRAFT_2872286 [Mycena olivaceomarginata]